MKLKACLIASTAMIASTPAFAADIPVVAEPVEYVAVCDAYGSGYFQLPGKDTCIKVGGRIRTWYTSHNLMEKSGVIREAKDAQVQIYDPATGEVVKTSAITSISGKEEDNIAEWSGVGGTSKRDEVKKLLEAEREKRWNATIDKPDPDNAGETIEGDYDDQAAKDAAIQAINDELEKFANEKETAEKIEEKRNDYNLKTRGYLTLESMTQTDLMSIKTYLMLRADWGDNAESSLGVYNSYVQFGFDGVDILLGRYASVFAPFAGYTLAYNGMPVGGDSALQARVTFEAMDGFTAAFGVESSQYSEGVEKGLDFTGAFNFTSGMVSGGVMGVAHNYAESEYGYGVSSFVELSPTDKITLGFGGTYVQDALYYLDAGFNNSGFENGSGVTGYAVYAGVSFDVTDQVNFALDGAFERLEENGISYDAHGVNATLTFKPVSGLALAVDGGMWQDSKDNEQAKITGRVQYTF